MSHFSCLVVGDVDTNLAPFHEFECTGRDDAYVQDLDDTADLLEVYAKRDPQHHDATPEAYLSEYYGRPVLREADTPNLDKDHKYGYLVCTPQGQLVRAIDRTNPNAKWDHYTVGGRWHGCLIRTDGAKVDTLTKATLDLDAMRQHDDDRARQAYKSTGYALDLTWRTWGDIVADEQAGDIQAKRDLYHTQPELVALKNRHRSNLKDPMAGAFFDYDTLLGHTEHSYVAAHSAGGIPAYAVVKDQQWAARGEMGWFGMSTDAMDRASWVQQVTDLIQSLPDDTVLTIVDCHI